MGNVFVTVHVMFPGSSVQGPWQASQRSYVLHGEFFSSYKSATSWPSGLLVQFLSAGCFGKLW